MCAYSTKTHCHIRSLPVVTIYFNVDTKKTSSRDIMSLPGTQRKHEVWYRGILNGSVSHVNAELSKQSSHVFRRIQ